MSISLSSFSYSGVVKSFGDETAWHRAINNDDLGRAIVFTDPSFGVASTMTPTPGYSPWNPRTPLPHLLVCRGNPRTPLPHLLVCRGNPRTPLQVLQRRKGNRPRLHPAPRTGFSGKKTVSHRGRGVGRFLLHTTRCRNRVGRFPFDTIQRGNRVGRFPLHTNKCGKAVEHFPFRVCNSGRGVGRFKRLFPARPWV